MKSKKGITLIALVITIIILIILAGVAINLSIGDNGIFSKAKQAKEEYANAQGYEETQINSIDSEIEIASGRTNGTQSSNVDYKFFGDYVHTTAWTKVATYDELKDYKLFVLSFYWGSYHKASSTIFTLDEILLCTNGALGMADIFRGSNAYVNMKYEEAEKAVYLQVSDNLYYGRLMGIK